MQEIRCKNCNQLLCKMTFGEVEIKCHNSRCKAVNIIKIISARHLLQLTVEEETAILKAEAH